MTTVEEAERLRLENTEAAYPSRGYAWYVVGVLLVVYTFSFIDRQILNLLVGPIRRDLEISDTGLSVLTGFSFAIFYTLFGLPLGRIADSYSRRGLIAAGFVMWSLFSAGCGLARNFAQMLLMRTGVGIGEATLAPAAFSLIVDYFPPERRATAQSVYAAGVYVGAGLAYVLGGIVIATTAASADYVLPLIGTVRSWQLVFFAIGLPGVVFALLLFTVMEPARRGAGAKRTIPLKDVLSYYKDNRATFARHHAGVAVNFLAAYGAAAWVPSFFIRHHHWSAAQFGAVFGPEVAVCGVLGLVFGGWLADRYAAKGRRDACMRVIVLAIVLWLPFGVAYLLVPNATVAIALLAPTLFFLAMPLGTMSAALMEVTPARMRGQAAAIMLFIGNIVGLGFGPTAIALFTDYVFRDDNLVGSSLLIVCTAMQLLAAILFATGIKPFLRTKERLAQSGFV
jgi:MFS family permease